MTRSTSFLSSRFIAKTLIVGGLASCPLLLNADITLSQSYSTPRAMGCDYYENGSNNAWVYGVLNWANQQANTQAIVQVDLNRYVGFPIFRYVNIATDANDGSGPNGTISAVAVSPTTNPGYYEGMTLHNASFLTSDISRVRYRVCQ